MKFFALKYLLLKERRLSERFHRFKDLIDRIGRRVKYRFITVLMEFATNLIKVNQ